MTAADRVRVLLEAAELKEQIRTVEKQLDLYRLPSPERMVRLERLVDLQRELIRWQRGNE